MAYEFNPLAKRGFDKYISESELPPELDALEVSDTNTVDLTLDGNTLSADVLYQDTATIDLGDDASGLKADVKDGSITYAKIQNISATDKLLGRSTAGAGSAEEIACTAFARSILDDADEATFKATVNLEIGTDVQAHNAVLTKLTALTDPNADRVPFWNDTSGNFEWKDFANWDTAYGWGDHAGLYDDIGSAATAQSNAESYADGLAVNYEAAGAIATHAALQNVHGLNITATKTLTVQDDVTITGALGSAAYAATTDFAAALGEDDNYVTDVEKAALHAAGSDDTFTVADEATDETCFPLFVTAATGDLGARTNAGLTFDSANGILTATGFVGALTGNVTGDCSGSSGSCTGNAATVTGLTLNSKSLTLNTGALTLTANADDSSVLTIGSGAVSVSGSNTGDQDLSSYLTDITGESIGDLSDVNLTGIAEGKVLKANALGNWVIGDDNNTTYVSSDFDHDALTNFVANEHIDWTNASSALVTSNNITGADLTSTDDIICGDDMNFTGANAIVNFSGASWAKINAVNGVLYLNYDYPNNAIHLGSSAGYAADRINGSLAYLTNAGDPTPVANYAQVFAKDVSTSAEMFVQDEAGNETQISPHDPETGEYIFYSENIYTGRKVRINMEQLVRAVEKLTGETFLIEEFTSEKKKWEDREYPDGVSAKELNKLKAESPVKFVADAMGEK